MRKPNYQPDRGDFIWLDFSPHAGTEQVGRRPALILSPKAFNIATGLAFACPITSQIKGGSFEVVVSKIAGLGGVILCDHLRSVDWLERKAAFHSTCPPDLLEEVIGRVGAIMAIDRM